MIGGQQIQEVLQKVASKIELSPVEWILAGQAIFRGRKRHALTQMEAAKRLKIPRRKLQKLEAAGRWSKARRQYIEQNDGFLSQFDLKTLSERSWSDTKAFKNAVDRIVEGKKLRRKRIRKLEEVISENGPDRFNEIEIFTDALKTKVDIQGDKNGQIVIYFHNWEQYDRIKELIIKP